MADLMPDFGMPDWGLTHASQKDIGSVQFGDGYTLRKPNGINFTRRVWGGLSWSSLSNEDALALYQFLDDRADQTAFDWVTPDGETVRVLCSGPSRTQQDFDDTVISVTFTEDFNP